MRKGLWLLLVETNPMTGHDKGSGKGDPEKTAMASSNPGYCIAPLYSDHRRGPGTAHTPRLVQPGCPATVPPSCKCGTGVQKCPVGDQGMQGGMDIKMAPTSVSCTTWLLLALDERKSLLLQNRAEGASLPDSAKIMRLH